jgi:dTMP kinase
MNGLLITLEGLDGTGKTTQIDLLAKYLGEVGRTVLLVREPGGCPIGEEIRYTLKHSPRNHAMTNKSELLLMNASRAQLVEEMICPALAEGKVVLCDRFYDSTTAYQGHGRGLNENAVKSIIDFAVGETRPDLTFLLHVPLDVCDARRRSRSTHLLRDRMEEVDHTFFERVMRGYQLIASAEPQRVRVVDGTKSIEVVHKTILSHLNPLLNVHSEPPLRQQL